ncbi:glycoside hydrolase family 2 TIM barrel-domain containing protein [Clostridiaceae bacterium M8S5]|nr:glycoside hydrolase family 2 TIM barrel-domain containing protein [Clostridiaceae bacterium M8S5]
MKSRWFDYVDCSCPLPEYPRPQMVRPKWINLNGLWEYAITPKDAQQPKEYDGTILVPFCIESLLSGVQKRLSNEEFLWYRRTFEYETLNEQKLLLHFGAVDWKANVWLNNHYLGSHTGGYLPFTFDVSNFIIDGSNELVVSVWDPTDSYWQQCGKQRSINKGIYYTPISGIWQTVWLEPVPVTYIEDIKITPDIDSELVKIICYANNNFDVRLTIIHNGEVEAISKGKVSEEIDITIQSPQLWSPDSPFLYDVVVELMQNEQVLDRIDSYFAMRKFSVTSDSMGIRRFALNNELIFIHGPLDQGYWPDGLYTAPTDEALRYDLELTKAMGFNMTRKHIKVEPARWYYHCDKLGIIVWQDMPCSSNAAYSRMEAIFTLWSGVRIYKRDDTTRRRLKLACRDTYESRLDFESELKGVIDTLYNVPSIGMWVLFNEAWGQYDAKRITEWCKDYDSSRLIDEASGWFHQGAGDVHSLHIYNKPLYIPKNILNKRVYVVSEYGGKTFRVEGNTWKGSKEFGYGKETSIKALTDSYISLIFNELKPITQEGCSGAVYTQLTDVEDEINGLITYDRKVVKMNIAQVAKVNSTIKY